MKTFIIMGTLVVVLFIAAQPEIQILIFGEFSKKLFFAGYGALGFLMLMAIVETGVRIPRKK